jgi:hypothetical protein
MDETELPQGPPAGIDGSFHADVACQSSRDIALGQPEKPLRDLHIWVEHWMCKRDFDVRVHRLSSLKSIIARRLAAAASLQSGLPIC